MTRAEFVEIWKKDDGTRVCLTCNEMPVSEEDEPEHLVKYHGWRRRSDGIVEYPEEDFIDYLNEHKDDTIL
jgi:hypothetical protein